MYEQMGIEKSNMNRESRIKNRHYYIRFSSHSAQKNGKEKGEGREPTPQNLPVSNSPCNLTSPQRTLSLSLAQ
jgi:hypothetical protein